MRTTESHILNSNKYAHKKTCGAVENRSRIDVVLDENSTPTPLHKYIVILDRLDFVQLVLPCSKQK
jgi:hypothetical protein